MRHPPRRAVGRVTVGLLVGGGALCALTACSGSAAPPAPSSTTSTTTTARAPVSLITPATTFTLDLTSGRIAPPWEFTRATLTTAPGIPARVLHLTAPAKPAFVSLPPRALAPGHTGYSFRARFRITARAAGQTVGLVTVENARRQANDDLFVDARTGRCRIDIFRADTARSPTRCDDGRWHTVTVVGDFATATATMSWTLDGAAMPRVTSTGQIPTTVRRLFVGDATPGKSNTTDWTGVAFALVRGA